MAKNYKGYAYFENNPSIVKIFQDLESYLGFCRSYGYKFNEADLYNKKSFAFQQFGKFLQRKNPKNMWNYDTPRR